MNKKIIFVGGGSGGHVIPATVIAKIFLNNGFDILWIGSKKKKELELQILKNEILNNLNPNNFKYFTISTCKFRRKSTLIKSIFSIENIIDFFNLIIGFFESFFILIKSKPKFIFSKGGFVSVPVLLAAKILKIPSFTHESDYSIGLANKINSKLSIKIFYSFDETLNNYDFLKTKGIFSGNPIRDNFRNFNENFKENIDFKNYLNSLFSNNKPILLILGGSLGAQSLNEIIVSNINFLKNYFNIIHQCGKNKIIMAKTEFYYPIEFINENIEKYIFYSNLIISRAGANTLFEILFLKRPAIFVPLTFATRGEQYLNANYFYKRELCLLYNEKELKENFINIFEDIIKNKKIEKIESNLKNINFPNSNEIIYENIIKIIN
jgi:UDP-N-acetylglucosamine--N-acetylmuramyl-(pentapeptide) pyrophosphoryl-undecaprenol N-acetylglucosamine transferase